VSQRVLIAEVLEDNRVNLENILSAEGYIVEGVSEGGTVIDKIQSKAYEVLLLNLDIPTRSGIDVLRLIQETSPQTRVILLSSRGTFESARKDLRTRVFDYLVTPVNRRQVIQAVQRAIGLPLQRGVQEPQGLYTIDQPVEPLVYDRADGIRIDLNRRTIRWENESIQLTNSETRLLGAFLENAGQVVSHVELVRRVQGYEASAAEAPLILRPLVSRLRQKITQVPGGGSWIVNIRGTGYMYERRAHTGE